MRSEHHPLAELLLFFWLLPLYSCLSFFQSLYFKIIPTVAQHLFVGATNAAWWDPAWTPRWRLFSPMRICNQIPNPMTHRWCREQRKLAVAEQGWEGKRDEWKARWNSVPSNLISLPPSTNALRRCRFQTFAHYQLSLSLSFPFVSSTSLSSSHTLSVSWGFSFLTLFLLPLPLPPRPSPPLPCVLLLPVFSSRHRLLDDTLLLFLV